MQHNNKNLNFHFPRVVLAGMMGSGKTTVAKILAGYLDWDFIDTDRLIEGEFGKTVREIFEQKGEQFFRDLEQKLVVELGSKRFCIIATGGGMIVSEQNRRTLFDDSLVVHLNSSIQRLLERLNNVSNRPLLANKEKQEELQKIYQSRAKIYEGLPVQILADNKSSIQIAQEILFHLVNSHEVISPKKHTVHVGCNLTRELKKILENKKISSPVFILADEKFWKLAGQFYIGKLKKRSQKFDSVPILLPSSEESKSIETVNFLWEKMIEHHADRSSCLVVLGGGVLGDVGGFVASTLFRGIRLIQIPTTLLAQIDSSIGGKTGVNLGEIKNMVGTFYPAGNTLLDPLLLLTLPQREMRSGVAEMIKVALLGDKKFFEFLEKEIDSILDCKIVKLQQAVTWAAEIKVKIFEQDLFEKDGNRILLNLGHTFGHAIEVLSNYELRHGEAVAIGMVLATKLSVRMNLCQSQVLDRLTNLLLQAKLPIEISDLSKEKILSKIEKDKKRTFQQLRFVFPRDIGKAEAIVVKSIDQLMQVFDEGAKHS